MLNVRKIEPLLRIVGSVSPIPVRAGLFRLNLSQKLSCHRYLSQCCHNKKSSKINTLNHFVTCHISCLGVILTLGKLSNHIFLSQKLSCHSYLSQRCHNKKYRKINSLNHFVTRHRSSLEVILTLGNVFLYIYASVLP